MSQRLDTRVREILRQREVVARVSDDEKEARKKLNEMEAQFISALEDENTKTWVGDVGPPYGEVRMTVRRTPKARILNKQVLISALRERGLSEEFLRPEPRKKNLNAYVKALNESGEPLPEGLDYYEDKGLTMTKVKKR